MEDWIYWWKKNFWKNNNLATYPNLITKVNISRKWKAFLMKLMEKLILLIYLIKINETILNRNTDGFKGMVTVIAMLLNFL